MDDSNVIALLTTKPEIMVKGVHSHIFGVLNSPFIETNSEKICKLKSLAQPLGPKGKVGVPYIIKIGNEKYVIKYSSIESVFCKYKDSMENSTDISCLTNTPLDQTAYIVSDEFTNESLIAKILEYLTLFLPNLPPLFVKHYEAGICKTERGLEGLNLMEFCDLGSLDNLKLPIFQYRFSKTLKVVDSYDEETVYQILTQVAVALDMLNKTIEFISGDLKTGNILVKSEPINTTYRGIVLKAPFTCKIADYGKSSCILYRKQHKSLRFYNSSCLADIVLKIYPFSNEIKGEYYKIKTPNPILCTRSRHMGVPFYNSFDYYTFLVSLLTLPRFFYRFFTSSYLYNIFWKDILPDEIFYKIEQYLDKNRSINNSYNILKDIPLNCDALEMVIKRLAK